MRKNVVIIESSALHLKDSTIERLRKLKEGHDETFDSLLDRLMIHWLETGGTK